MLRDLLLVSSWFHANQTTARRMGCVHLRDVAEVSDPSFSDTEHPNWAFHVHLRVFRLRLVVSCQGFQMQLLTMSIAILYVNLESFPIVFQEKRGWGHVTGGLPFVALLVGIFAAAAANVYNNRYYFRKLRENNGKAVPEARLPPMMVGGVFFTGGLFLFACQCLTPRNYPLFPTN